MNATQTTTAQQIDDDPLFTVQDRRRKGFFTIDNDLLDRFGEQLGPYGLAVYMALARFADQDSECYPSQSTIAKRTGMSRMQVSRVIEKLQKLQLISALQQTAPNGAQRTNLYILYDLPPVTDSYTPCNSELHPPVTDSYTPCNTQLHKQNIVNKTHKEQDTKQQQRRARNNAVPDSKKDVVVALTAHGIADGVAKRLAKRYGKKRMEEKIEYLDFLLAVRPAEVKKPAAWLRRAIEENYSEPDGYISKEERERLAVEEEKQAEEAERQAVAVETSHKVVKEEKQAEQAARVRALREEHSTSEEYLELWEKTKTELKYTATPDINALIPELEMLSVRDGTVLLGAWTEATWRRLQHPGTAKVIERALSQAVGSPAELQVLEIKPSTLSM
jgi:hypothetical protein